MRLARLTQIVRTYDLDLYVDLSVHGVPCVFRRTKGVERFELDGCTILRIVDQPHLVFALTDTWNINGRPVDWGAEPILARLKECDLHKRDIVADLEKDYAKDEEAKSRKLRNDAEAMFADSRREFARATDGINTALIKSDKNRRV